MLYRLIARHAMFTLSAMPPGLRRCQRDAERAAKEAHSHAFVHVFPFARLFFAAWRYR